MDTVVTDVVSTTATKIQVNKYFLLGAVAGVATGVAVLGAVKLKQKIAERRENDLNENSL